MSLCLAAAGMVVALGSDAATLQWRHSVEKILWEEDWIDKNGALSITQARVRGSGAGMEPPPEAQLKEGAWRWKPALKPQAEVILRRSGATADWSLCIKGACRQIDALLPKDADPVILKACP